VTEAPRSTPAFRVYGRSFLVLVLRPEPPVEAWLAELDAQVARSPTFLDSKPVLVDLAGVTAGDADLPGLVRGLQGRGLRILAVEGADPSWAGAAEWGRAIPGGRATGIVEAPAAEPEPAPPEAAGLVIAEPVRSGQSVIYPKGDVTVIGSIASGAEVFAGGSVHVYGTLRGRVVAGFTGNPGARVFCRRLEAELVAIDGVYRTADDMDATLRGRAVQAWLDGGSIVMAALD
jgi:septum site-determining protein MinC